MMLTLSGPVDKPAMDINVVIDPIFLTISPAIVRLIIHAAQTLTPEKVRSYTIRHCFRLLISQVKLIASIERTIHCCCLGDREAGSSS